MVTVLNCPDFWCFRYLSVLYLEANLNVLFLDAKCILYLWWRAWWRRQSLDQKPPDDSAWHAVVVVDHSGTIFRTFRLNIVNPDLFQTRHRGWAALDRGQDRSRGPARAGSLFWLLHLLTMASSCVRGWGWQLSERMASESLLLLLFSQSPGLVLQLQVVEASFCLVSEVSENRQVKFYISAAGLVFLNMPESGFYSVLI